MDNPNSVVREKTMKGLCVRMPIELHRRLRKHSYESEVPQIEIMRRALIDYLDSAEQAERKSA